MASRKIKINGEEISYFVRESARARKLRLTIYADKGLVATKPVKINEIFVERFISKKAKWVLNKLKLLESINSERVGQEVGGQNYSQYKSSALIFAKRRIEELNRIYGFQFNKISIKNQMTRWGSCSRKGNLNFNYKIVLLPGEIADYIIVHELCHLKEMNHSKRFWDLVAIAAPDYLSIRKELRRVSLRLM